MTLQLATLVILEALRGERLRFSSQEEDSFDKA